MGNVRAHSMFETMNSLSSSYTLSFDKLLTLRCRQQMESSSDSGEEDDEVVEEESEVVATGDGPNILFVTEKVQHHGSGLLNSQHAHAC